MKYDNNKSVKQNLMALINYVNFNYHEMTKGRVPQIQEKEQQDNIQAQQTITDLDLANIQAEQTITDLDLRVLELEAKNEQ